MLNKAALVLGVGLSSGSQLPSHPLEKMLGPLPVLESYAPLAQPWGQWLRVSVDSFESVPSCEDAVARLPLAQVIGQNNEMMIWAIGASRTGSRFDILTVCSKPSHALMNVYRRERQVAVSPQASSFRFPVGHWGVGEQTLELGPSCAKLPEQAREMGVSMQVLASDVEGYFIGVMPSDADGDGRYESEVLTVCQISDGQALLVYRVDPDRL